MKHTIYTLFLAVIILVSLFIQYYMSSATESFSTIKDGSGNTYVVEGDYKYNNNGDITNANGSIIKFDEITETKTKISDASGKMLNLDAEGDSQFNVIDGKIYKNNDWNADTAFPEYHESASALAEKDPNIKSGKMYVKDPSGNIIEIPWTGKQTPINYNESGYFRFQPSNFIPGYEDSVYLSRLTGHSTTKPIDNNTSSMRGFCEYHKYSPIKKEEGCSKLDKNACASTSCCVLLGGSRCVGGNEKGPTMKSHYGDITILNRDHYYYQGKCYGNCPH